MSPKEYFALVLRIIGVLIAANGLRYILDSGLGVLGYFTTERPAYSFYLIIGLIHFFVGLYFLRGAPLIVRFAYPENWKENVDEDIELNSQSDAEQVIRADRE